MEFTKSEAKKWAKENYRGLESILMPSFTPDLAELDEEGIRHDVQFFIKQGWFSALCALPSCGMTFEERKKFVEIVNDEAKGKIWVSIFILQDTIEQDIEMLKHHEKVGGTHALIGYPVTFYPESEEDVYQVTKKMCDSTNLAIDIYASPKFNFERFHPSAFNPRFLVRIADIENVVALKIGLLDPPAYVDECFRLVGDKILVNNPVETWFPIVVTKYGQQWAGGGPYDIYQSPDNPLLTKEFDLLLSSKLDEAMDIYWKLTPIRQFRVQQMTQYGAGGVYHYAQWKYCQWLVGGNGGMLRTPVQRLYEHDTEAIKKAMKTAGITIREASEEEFYVGRVNYTKGARIK